jgi:hypothetical protein
MINKEDQQLDTIQSKMTARRSDIESFRELKKMDDNEKLLNEQVHII